MKKTSFFLFIALLLIHFSSAACLQEGITFSSQSEINSFQANFPGCTSIEGDVLIKGNDISDLSGLNMVISIAGDLNIGDIWGGNPILINLTGLESLTTIGGSLNIISNINLITLTGLDTLKNIGYDLLLSHNGNLNSLSGLEQLSFIGRDFISVGNYRLTNLSALGNLNGDIRNMHFYDNWALLNFNGLEKISFIGGNLFICGTSVTNLSGLNNLMEIAGDVTIGNFAWGGNPSLHSLSGLESLVYIQGNISISANDSLIDLTGLSNLSSIGASLGISWNPMLSNLAGLEGLTSIGGSLTVGSNNSLTDISGLENITPGSITNLYIDYNDLLSICHIKSVCGFLASPNGKIIFEENAEGCMNQSEVEKACNTVAVNEVIPEEIISVYPNPTSGNAVISFPLLKHSVVKLQIVSYQGKNVLTILNEELNPGVHQINIDTKSLPAGLYFCRLCRSSEESIIKVLVM